VAARLLEGVGPFGPPGLLLLDLRDDLRLERGVLGLAVAAEAGLDRLADVALVLVDEPAELPLRVARRRGGEDLRQDLHHLEEVERDADLVEERVLLDVDPGRAAADLGVGEAGLGLLAPLLQPLQAAFDDRRLDVDHERAGFDVEAEGELDGRLDDLLLPGGELEDRPHGIHRFGLGPDVHEAAILPRRHGDGDDYAASRARGCSEAAAIWIERTASRAS